MSCSRSSLSRPRTGRRHEAGLRQPGPDRDHGRRAGLLRIYQLTVLYDFPTDARLGLNLAFYRIFAIPRIADLLPESCEMLGRPAKRA